MTLINDTCILKNLPLGLGKRQTLILDTLRFLMEMVDYSYSQLENNLLQISKSDGKRNTPATFGYIWSIIDNAIRIVNISKKLPWEFPDQVFGHLYYLKDFRNTFQHIEDRIDESLLKTQSPFLGVVTWTYLDLDTKEFKLVQLISGNLLHGPNAEQTVPNLEHSNNELNSICLHTVNRKGEKIKCDISEIIQNLKRLVCELEKQFENFSPIDWSTRQDVVLHIKSPKN